MDYSVLLVKEKILASRQSFSKNLITISGAVLSDYFIQIDLKKYVQNATHYTRDFSDY